MDWKNQLRKAPFGPFKRKKPEPQSAETPEEAKKNKEIKLAQDALDIIYRADSEDSSEPFGGEKTKTEIHNNLLDKMMKFQYNDNYTFMGQGGIEGLKSFIGYLERSAGSYAIREGARDALEFVQSKEGQLQ